MTGFSLANMVSLIYVYELLEKLTNVQDYTPVKFMIKCFEANYPESLGVCVIHKAPWVFQGIWKIIRGWLDPVVSAKVHFTNNIPELEEFVDKSSIVSEMGGDNPYEYEFIPPKEGENKLFEDTATRDQIEASRTEMISKFEELTGEWMTSSSSESAGFLSQRNDLAAQMKENYWQLDPYIRARNFYDRIGVIQPGGKIDWSVAVGRKSAKALDPSAKPTPVNTDATAKSTAPANGLTSPTDGATDNEEDDFFDAEEGGAATVADGIEGKVADKAAKPNAAPAGSGAANVAAGAEDRLAEEAAKMKLENGGPKPAGHEEDALD